MSSPNTDILSTNIMTLSTTPQSTKNLESTERKRTHQRSASSKMTILPYFLIYFSDTTTYSRDICPMGKINTEYPSHPNGSESKATKCAIEKGSSS